MAVLTKICPMVIHFFTAYFKRRITSSASDSYTVLHTLCSNPLTSNPQALWNVFSIGLLYMGVNWIGLYTKYLTERAQRKAFLETRRSLEMRFKTQKENERQERLLLSVLPSFVAQQMIRDIALEEERAMGELREFEPSQFHKIYIHRYEQVSILFADIKGFTGRQSASVAKCLSCKGVT
jgi:adenylate cyclase 8